MSDFADSLFWDNVSGEHERQQRTSALAHSKVAAAAYWPFLASAGSERDFDNRLEIVSERLASLVDPSVYDDVISSLRDDYRLVTGGKNPFAKDDDDDDKSEGDKKDDDESDDADDKAEDETGTDNDDDDSDDDSKDDGDDDDSNDDDQDDKDKSGQPSWLNKKNKDESKTGAYVPDPTDKDRYYPPYANLESLPLNNGDLQGPDGYIKDLAEGEGRSQERMQFQTTPGTWTQGDGMPERPMPQGVERGYQPVASLSFDKEGFLVVAGREHHAPWDRSVFDVGYKHAYEGRDRSTARWTPSAQHAYNDGYGTGHNERAFAEANPDEETYDNGKDHSNRIHPKTTGLVTANQYIKQQGDQWVITQKGTGKVLSHHDSEEKANEAFRAMEWSKHKGGLDENGFLYPDDPRDVLRKKLEGQDTEREPIPKDYMSRGYDELNRAQYKPKHESSLDAQGFLIESVVDPVPGAPLTSNPWFFGTDSQGLVGNGFPQEPGQDPQDYKVDDYGDVPPQASSGSTEGYQDGNGYSRSNPGRTASQGPRNFPRPS